MEMVPRLRTRNITKIFPGTIALNDVSLDFFAGEVHAIMGENGAGKSTLLNILTGSLEPSSGYIEVNGKQLSFGGPHDAQEVGIVAVHQEISLFPHLSVMENIAIHHASNRIGWMDRSHMEQVAQTCLQEFNPKFSLNSKVKTLSVSEQQIVEIARAMTFDADVYIFDEPTATLSSKDVESLFVLLNRLKDQGKAIVYVSHKFDEIFHIADRVSVLRDGILVGSDRSENLNSEIVIKLMVGRNLDAFYPEKANHVLETKIMKVLKVSAGSKCKDVSFDLYQGEILGIFGLVGSGRTEIARAITGIDHREHGTVVLNGRELPQRSVRDSIRHRLYYVTEDRKGQGLFLKMSIESNAVANRLNAVCRGLFIKNSKVQQVSENIIGDFNVKCTSGRQKVGSLSGGNQQKLLIGSWVKRDPEVIILDEPTRGIDVGAKAEIHLLLRRLASSGVGTIMISSELPEIIGVSDRVLVVYDGSIVANLSRSEITEENIMKYASGL